jgi:hypothetical protein
MVKKNSVLADFKEAESIPPMRRTSWARKVLDEFMQDVRSILYTEFEDDKKATAKQAALTREVKAEGSPFAGKVNVQRRGNRVYLEKM